MMRHTPKLLAVAITATLAAASAEHARADIAIDQIGDYEVSLEGLMQADGNWFNNDVADLNGAGLVNGKDTEFEMRRSEVVLKGKGTDFDWVLGYDGKANKWLDVNLKWKLGSSYLQAGQFKQPNSLEELSSTKNNDFIAKSMITNTYGISRRLGVQYGGGGQDWGYTLSYFSRELTRNLAHGQGWGGRFYYAPINASGSVLHFGVSAVDYDNQHDTQRFNSRPDADLATVRLIDTGNVLNTDRNRTIGLEGMWINGPFKVQSEYMQTNTSRVNSSFGPSFSGDGWYVSGVWNMTGETWGYKGGVPSTPLPNEPVFGMWQLALRYDKMDLNDFPVLGGEEHNITAGVNWYWRSNFKISANYVKVNSTRRGISDDPDIFETRLQFYW